MLECHRSRTKHTEVPPLNLIPSALGQPYKQPQLAVVNLASQQLSRPQSHGYDTFRVLQAQGDTADVWNWYPLCATTCAEYQTTRWGV